MRARFHRTELLEAFSPRGRRFVVGPSRGIGTRARPLIEFFHSVVRPRQPAACVTHSTLR